MKIKKLSKSLLESFTEFIKKAKVDKSFMYLVKNDPYPPIFNFSYIPHKKSVSISANFYIYVENATDLKHIERTLKNFSYLNDKYTLFSTFDYRNMYPYVDGFVYKVVVEFSKKEKQC